MPRKPEPNPEVEQVLSTMSRVMRVALVDFAAGVRIHGREMSSLIDRNLVEQNHRCLTRLGQQTVNHIIEEKK